MGERDRWTASEKQNPSPTFVNSFPRGEPQSLVTKQITLNEHIAMVARKGQGSIVIGDQKT